MTPRIPWLFQRLISRVEVSGDCFLWLKGTNRGYGQINLKRRGRARVRLAHRLMWIAVHGRIPRGLRVMHTCDTPSCIAPWHLRVGTAADNSRDMAEKGRVRGGPGCCHGPVEFAHLYKNARLHRQSGNDWRAPASAVKEALGARFYAG